jgi:hypothetical protein
MRWLPEYRAGRLEPTARAIYRATYVGLWTLGFVFTALGFTVDEFAWAVPAIWAFAAGFILFCWFYVGDL